jgi:hypothetical protein
VWSLALLALACSGDGSSPPSTPTPGAPKLTAPSIDAPSSDAQLDTLRPTLTVSNGTSDQPAGGRTYEFQVSDNSNFAAATAPGLSGFAATVSKTGVPESASGKTSFTVESDLQPATRYYWRARLVQGSTSSDWSSAGTFRSKLVGFNRGAELYDPLIHSETVGAPFGSTSFVPGKGLRIESESAYLRYQLAQTIPAGEFSVEVEGLRPNGPGTSEGSKLKVFSMMDGTGDLISSRYQLSVQYRGVNGNPDNAISFKAVWGDRDVKLEPDFAQRAAGVRALDPARTYFWQATWTPTTFRLVVRDDSSTGNVIYDRAITAPPGTGPYAPTPHFAYLGANSGFYNTETGSWPGAIYRNVWLSDKPRPASLGSALAGLTRRP